MYGLGVVLPGRGPSRSDLTGHPSCRDLLRIARTWCTGEVPGSTQVMGITELRAHPGRILVVFGTPIAFAITGFLHLVPETDAPNIYTGLRDSAGLGIAIHVVQLLLILLLAVAVYWLTEGLTSTAARISRVALLPYLVFYSAFDAVVGLSNGLVVNYGSELPPAEQAVLAGASDALADLVHHPVPLTIYLIGTLSWAVAVIAAAVALSQAGAPRTAAIPLGLAGVIGAVDHAAPFGPVAMLLFIIATFLLSRTRTAQPTSDLTGGI